MLKKLAFAFLLQCLGIMVYAQIIQDGIVFGGPGNQQISKCFIDKIGNKYLLVEYGENFIIDSAGTPITIEKSKTTISSQLNNSLAIIKLDNKEKYLYHVKFEGNSHYGSRLDIKFDNDNHAYVRYNFSQEDTINLIGTQGQLYKSIIQTFNRISSNSNNLASLLLKLTSSGEFAWTNTIFYENSGNTSHITWTHNNISINNYNEVSLFYPVTNNIGFVSDTIALINNLGQKNLHIVNSPNCLFRFDKFGNFISVKEPFKNSLNQTKVNSFGSGSFNEHISDGQNTYIITTFSLTDVDTFKANGISIPLNSGFYYFLVKLNAIDSIVLAKPIAKNITNFLNMTKINLALNKYKTELSIDCVHNPSLYHFLLNQNFNNNGIGRYLGRFSSDGDLISETLFAGTVISFSNYNQSSNDLTVIGRIVGSDTKLNPFLPINTLNNPITFIAYLDSLNNVISAQPIISNNKQMSTGISLNFEMGNPLTDLSGRTFIPGWFRDSITLPCKKLMGDLDKDTADFGIIVSYSDGFLLRTQPFKYIDTAACQKILSPSGKYTWTSNGVYFDTLANNFGCDSILRFRVSIQSNQFNIDTAVRYNLVSPSKKYTWDSTGLYVDSLVNKFGCDSILFINLRVLNNKNKLDTFNCKPISYWSKNEIIKQSGTFFDTIPNSIGGDSIITILFTLGSSQSTLDTSNCAPINSLSGKYLYTQSGQYVDTITNSFFCDSIVTINYTRTPTKDTIYVSSCTPYTGVSGRLAVFSDGLYLDTLSSSLGCDSMLYIFFTSLNTSSAIQIKSCDSVVSPSKKYVFRQSGLYQDTLTNQFNCDSVITIQLSVEPLNIAVSKSNNITCDSPFAQLEVTGGTIFKWWPETALTNHQVFNPIANPEKNTWYYVLVRTEIGCEASDSIEILVNKDPEEQEIANVFTPNNDGLNDCFPIEGIAKFVAVEIEIFNRWGAPMFKSNNPKACWDGNAQNGQKATEGTYFYVLTGKSICSKNVQLHGTITLIR